MIKDTESLFKSREKEYQDTIDQIEVEFLLVPKHLHDVFSLLYQTHNSFLSSKANNIERCLDNIA